MGRFVNVTPSWPIVSPCNRRMCPHLHTRIPTSLPSHTRPHRAREIAAKTTTDCNAALYISDMRDYPRGGVVPGRPCGRCEDKVGIQTTCILPDRGQGSKIDKPLNPDQIKKMVKKKMKQDHASINLFELILFRNRKVKETVPEKSCFKYNLAALGFALNSFADTINSVEFANSKNALPAEVMFLLPGQWHSHALTSLRQSFTHLRVNASFIELSEKLVGAPILMRPETLTTEGYIRAARQVVTKLSNMHKRAQDSMVCSFGHLKSFASQRRCWQFSERIQKFANALGRNRKEHQRGDIRNPINYEQRRNVLQGPCSMEQRIESKCKHPPVNSIMQPANV